jgi:hypothetical protein
MIIQNDPGIDLEAFVLPAVCERADNDAATSSRGENWEPFDDCGGDKVGVLAFVDAVATAHGWHFDEAELLRQARSQAGAWERGEPARNRSGAIFTGQSKIILAPARS